MLLQFKIPSNDNDKNINMNGRIYFEEMLKKEIERYVKSGKIYGEMKHEPENTFIAIDTTSFAARGYKLSDIENILDHAAVILSQTYKNKPLYKKWLSRPSSFDANEIQQVMEAIKKEYAEYDEKERKGSHS